MDNDHPLNATAGRRDVLRSVLLGAGATVAAAASGGAYAQSGGAAAPPAATIINARVFDGEWVLDADSVAVENGYITEVGKNLPRHGVVIDARGGTLLPGLTEAHCHPGDVQSLRLAALFGVTTVLDMGGFWTPETRKAALADDQAADFRTTLLGMSPPGGHPGELTDKPFPTSNTITADDARAYVQRDVDNDFDYVKIILEDGEVMGKRVPMLSKEAIYAAVVAGHAAGKMVIAHAMTHDTVELALSAGVDGLAHLYFDNPPNSPLVHKIARARLFLVPCLVLNRSMVGLSDAAFANDPRVANKLPKMGLREISGSLDTYPAGRYEDLLATVAALKEAGVDLLTGTDGGPLSKSARPGFAVVGPSLHRELQHFVEAGFTPIETLRAATSLPARRFDLRDRGRIQLGLRADLLLVDGDPTRDISATLSIKKVWKKGVEIMGAAVA